LYAQKAGYARPLPYSRSNSGHKEGWIGTIIYTDINKDGTLQGTNIDGIREILENTDVNVIASGRVKYTDIEKLKALGIRA
jgi:phosphoribosylformimino-5-aminoimidazole carboxamide ribotide isomerase